MRTPTRRYVIALGFAVAALAALVTLAPSPARAGRPPLVDEPVRWDAGDRGAIAKPVVRDPSLVRDYFDETVVRPVGRMTNPVRLSRHVAGIWGTEVAHSASDINAIDEAYNSTWFTNRIGVRPISAQEAARGAVTSDGPDRSKPWKVVKTKTQGVTVGFNIKDAAGKTYVMKFDPQNYMGTTTAAGVIAGRLLWAAGYNVSQDFVVEFRRDQLFVGPDVKVPSGERGEKRAMTEADLDTILTHAPKYPDGTYRAIASQFLPGEILGPMDWKGYKKSDPFDRVKHENRRTLRGLRMLCAWLAHFDVKQHNTMDTFIKEGDRSYVRHFLFDFTATLGTGGLGPTAMLNYEYGVDFSAILGRMMALGISEDEWRKLKLPPDLPEIGYYEVEHFSPMEWKPLEPNAAFANMTTRDGYWAAKIVSAFRREHLEAAVAEGKYHDPRAAKYMVAMLEGRRDKLARFWFDRVPPLDFFTWRNGTLAFHDLGAERGIYPGTTARYRVRTGPCDAKRKVERWSNWSVITEPTVNLSQALGAASDRRPAASFLAIDVAVDRGKGFSRNIRVYLSPTSGRVIGLDR